MRGSLIASLIMHGLLLVSVLVTIKTQPLSIPKELEPMAVDLVTPSDVTKLRQGSRTAKQMEAAAKETPKSAESKKEAEKPKPTPATAPPPPPPPPEESKADPPEKAAAVPPPKAEAPPPPAAPPVPAPEEQKKLDDLVKQQEAERQKEEEKKVEEAKKREEAKKAADAKRKADEKKKREAELKKKKEEERKRKEAEAKAKSKNFTEDMASLLNKIPDKGAPPPPSESTAPNAKKGPVLGAPEGKDKQLSASELAILAQIIKSCVQTKWTVMSGGEGAQATVVKVRLRFNPDGRLAAPPSIMNPQNTPFFLAVSDSALRAVQACEPYPLPVDKYEVWKDIVLNFDPKDMF